MPRPLRPSTTQLRTVGFVRDGADRRCLLHSSKENYSTLNAKPRVTKDRCIFQSSPEGRNGRFYFPLTNRNAASTGDATLQPQRRRRHRHSQSFGEFISNACDSFMQLCEALQMTFYVETLLGYSLTSVGQLCEKSHRLQTNKVRNKRKLWS